MSDFACQAPNKQASPADVLVWHSEPDSRRATTINVTREDAKYQTAEKQKSNSLDIDAQSCTYHDHAAECKRAVSATGKPAPPVCPPMKLAFMGRFPSKLYAMLSMPQFSHIVSWLPHGRSWKIWDVAMLEELVLPSFFCSVNYNSFMRLVNAWGFRRIRNKPKNAKSDYNSYYHEMFLRGRSDLLQHMKRQPKHTKKLPISQSDEPDLRSFPPLPEFPKVDRSDLSFLSRKLGIKGIENHAEEVPYNVAVAQEPDLLNIAHVQRGKDEESDERDSHLKKAALSCAPQLGAAQLLRVRRSLYESPVLPSIVLSEAIPRDVLTGVRVPLAESCIWNERSTVDMYTLNNIIQANKARVIEERLKYEELCYRLGAMERQLLYTLDRKHHCS